MLGTSDVGFESVSADVQLDSSRTGLLSPCGSDRLAVPVVIVFFGAIIFQNPAGHEYTCCLSTLKPTSETGTFVVRFDVRSVDGTFALTMVLLLECRMLLEADAIVLSAIDGGKSCIAVARVNGYTRFVITPGISPFRQWLRRR